MARGKSQSVVERVASQIRADALRLEEGASLGLEGQLLERYRVSRPTLRQAASLVAQEQLLRVKRGVGGGYFVRRPSARAVARMASIYLRVRDASLTEVVTAFTPIRVELARLAALSTDHPTREVLRAFVAGVRPGEDVDFGAFVAEQRDFHALLGRLSGNQPLWLFLTILLDLASMVDREEDMYRGRADRIRHFRELRHRLAEAIVAGDEEMAVLAARRCADSSSQWLLEDLEGRSTARRGSPQELPLQAMEALAAVDSAAA